MSDWVIYHNPRCGKSRTTLEILEEHDIEPQIVLYLQDPPDQSILTDLLRKLGLRPRDLLRKGEKLLREIELDQEDDQAVVRAMVQHPSLIERPIVVHGDRAILGRPPNRVLELIGERSSD